MITYPNVTGRNVSGVESTYAVGDLVTGKDPHGRLVVGKIIATHPHYPSLTVEGVECEAGNVHKARAVVHVSKVLTHVRAPRSIGQRR